MAKVKEQQESVTVISASYHCNGSQAASGIPETMALLLTYDALEF